MTSIERQDQFIRSLGVEAYRVGGSVRDEIIGRKPKDADYIVRGIGLRALGFKLREVEGIPPKPLVDRQGQQFGWRTQPHGIEISLPRKEANAGTGRKQTITVDPALPLHEDCKRRDFTFNALYKPVMEGYETVADPTNTGLYDLQHRIIRTTHVNSFRDDPLRMLRAARFVSTLDADLSRDTWNQMKQWASSASGLTINGHTSGTVYDEFCKMLMGQQPAKALRLLRDTGVLEVVMPEIAAILDHNPCSKYHDLTTCEHTFRAIQTAANVDAPLRVRWALLFHDAGKPDVQWFDAHGRAHYYARKGGGVPFVANLGEGWKNQDHEIASAARWRSAAERMNVPTEMAKAVGTIVRHHMVPTKTKNPGTRARRMRVQFGDDLLRDLLLHRVCDLAGKNVKVALNHIEHIHKLERLRQEAAAAGVPASFKDLAIDGQDAIAAGLQGKAIGDALARVLDEVVCRPDAQTMNREWQLRRLSDLRDG